MIPIPPPGHLLQLPAVPPGKGAQHRPSQGQDVRVLLLHDRVPLGPHEARQGHPPQGGTVQVQPLRLRRGLERHAEGAQEECALQRELRPLLKF